MLPCRLMQFIGPETSGAPKAVPLRLHAVKNSRNVTFELA